MRLPRVHGVLLKRSTTCGLRYGGSGPSLARLLRAMVDLRTALQEAMPGLSGRCWMVLSALVARGGVIGSAQDFARTLGFTSRHQLARLLHREGLPQLQELGAWVYTLARLLDWETTRQSLCKNALGAGEDPASLYRRVQHACGVRWSEARAIGFDHMLVRFVQRRSRNALPLGESVSKQTA